MVSDFEVMKLKKPLGTYSLPEDIVTKGQRAIQCELIERLRQVLVTAALYDADMADMKSEFDWYLNKIEEEKARVSRRKAG